VEEGIQNFSFFRNNDQSRFGQAAPQDPVDLTLQQNF
jgi:hypothetical protein